MIGEQYYDNLGMVRDNISHTRNLLDSIEDDMQDIRKLIHYKVQSKIDRAQLLHLLQVENDCLKVTSRFSLVLFDEQVQYAFLHRQNFILLKQNFKQFIEIMMK